MSRRGIKVKDLVQSTGLAYSTINNIGDPKHPYKVRRQVAELIADALDVTVANLFQPDEVSDTGRLPLTGRPINKRHELITATVQICPVHRLVVPRTGICPDCEDN